MKKIKAAAFLIICLSSYLNAQKIIKEKWRRHSETDSIKVILNYDVERTPIYPDAMNPPRRINKGTINEIREDEDIFPANPPEEFFLIFNRNLKYSDFVVKHKLQETSSVYFKINKEGELIQETIEFIDENFKDNKDEILRVFTLTKDLKWTPAYKTKKSGEKENVDFIMMALIRF